MSFRNWNTEMFQLRDNMKAKKKLFLADVGYLNSLLKGQGCGGQ